MGIGQTSSSWINRFLLLLIIAALVAVDSPVLGWYGPNIAQWLGVSAAWIEPHRVMECLLILTMPVAIATGAIETVHLVIILLAGEVAPQVFPQPPSILVAKGSGIAVYLCLTLLIPPLRRTMPWARLGKIDGRSAALAGIVVPIAALALVAWAHWMHPNMSGYSPILPHGTRVELIEYMGLFAAGNALLEEILYRGVMLSALDAAFGAGWFGLVVQSVSFGMAHFLGGFPCGWVGVGMTFLYGLAMGLLRRRSNGLLLPWITHATADFAVICLIVYNA